VAVDGGDHRLGTSLDRREVIVHPLHESADLVGRVRRAAVDAAQDPQVRADAEVLLILGGEHDHTHGRVVTKFVECRGELLHEVLRDRVEAVAMHDDAGDRAFAFDVDEISHHAVKRGMPPATSITAPVM
jgi:hypothetical protein